MMGGGDHCAVSGCKNDRRYPERYVIKEHVNTLRFHSCRDKKHYAFWTQLLQRQDFTVKASTRVCSNHFKYGEPFPDDLHPSVFLKGYDLNQSPKRLPSDLSEPQPKKTRNYQYRSIGVQVNPAINIDFKAVEHDHSYTNILFKNKQFSSEFVTHLEDELEKLANKCEDLRHNLFEAQNNVKRLELDAQAKGNHLSIGDINHSDELINLYTGLPSFLHFQWLCEAVKPHAKNMHYYEGKASIEDKTYMYHIKNSEKPGSCGWERSQALEVEDELLMTLMKLRLNLREGDLAFRFGVSQSTVSQVISTWKPFLDKECYLHGMVDIPSTCT